MTRELKILVLPLVVALAASLAWASAASGTTQFHIGSPPEAEAVLTGGQEGSSNTFDVQFGEVKCTTAKYTAATELATFTTITFAPTFEGCTLAGVTTTIDMNGCDYLLHVNNEGAPYKGPLDIVCEAGKEITVTGGTKCTVHIPPQTGLGPITYANIGSGATSEITVNLSGAQNVTYSQTPGTGVGKCTAVTSTGKYTGTATVKAETALGSHLGLFASAASGTTQFHIGSPPEAEAVLTGGQEGSSNTFDVQFGEVKCTTAKYTAATELATFTTITFAPTFEGCTLAGVTTTIDMNGCDYLLHVNNEGAPYKGPLDIVCEAGKEITVTGGTKCTVHIPPQTGLGPITYANIGSGATSEITVNLSGAQNVTYSQTPGTGVGKCTAVTSTGKYTGTATVKAETALGSHLGLFASAASGTTQFHIGSPPEAEAVLTGGQEGSSNTFDVQFGEVKCTTAKYTAATELATFTTITFAPTFEGCTLAGVTTTIDMNGCDYLLHVNNEGAPYKGPLDIVCEAGKEITVTGGTKCTVHIPPQTGLGPITYANIGSGATSEITVNLSGAQNVTYSQTPGTGVGKCTAVTSTGKYTGTATVKAETALGSHLGLWVA